ncbi:MAG: transglutaminase domain-containing protein [Anaerolineae bacterium]|nr:transglutaminase domain-containing protein [Anaerolineae bacterium]
MKKNRRNDNSPRPERWWDLLGALLLLGAMTIAAARLGATDWTDHLGLVQTVVFLGLLTGLALGGSCFSPRIALLLSLAYGLFVVGWQLGVTLDEGSLWVERVSELLARLAKTAGLLARQESVRDPLLFLMLMDSLFWGVSLHAGYSLTRHGRPWQSIIPGGLLMLVIQAYDPYVSRRMWFVAFYLFLALLLVARFAYLRYQVEWRRYRAQTLPYMGLEIARTVIVVTLLLVLVSWSIPAAADAMPAVREAWLTVTKPWAELTERLGHAFDALRGTALVYVQDDYGDRLVLGTQFTASSELVLTVDAPPRSELMPPYYWRAHTYDTYADGRWRSVFSATMPITLAHFGATVPGLQHRETLTFTFTPATGLGIIYAAPQPLWIDRPVYADASPTPGGGLDMFALHAVTPLAAGEKYRAWSSPSTFTVSQLRSAGRDYPQWVRNRYLQLPPEITSQTYELAQELAQGLDNPYDIAVAVTTHLRTYPYSDTLPQDRPDEQEPLDWFLFDVQKGFCNYYASSEVILLRTLGIPARLAAGFSSGERQPETNIYLVHRYDLHAWPEVYFPTLGWVEFEPTATEVFIERPAGERATQDMDGPEGSGGAAGGEMGDGGRDRLEERLEELLALDPYAAGGSAPPPLRRRFPFGPLLLGLGALAVLLLWRVRQRQLLPPVSLLLERGMRRLGLGPPPALRRWARRSTLPLLERAYGEINRALSLLGGAPAPHYTPAERAAALIQLLPESAVYVRGLLAEYQATAYGPTPGDPYAAKRAGRIIRATSRRAFFRRLVGREA